MILSLDELRAKYPTIPDEILSDLRVWFLGERPYPFGEFVMAVLSNDLMRACHHADDYNRHILYDYAKLLFNEAPAGCWGTREKVAAWLKESYARAHGAPHAQVG